METFIGLTSSYLALLFGCLFFLYAVKYYASTILALSTLGRGKAAEAEPSASPGDVVRDEPFVSIHLPFYNEVNVARRVNKSENWVTRGVRAEFSGSYMVERYAAERYGGLKMISGSVFMLRADVLRRLGWGMSITEDWELTLRLYPEGYRVAYTPLIQASAEMPTTIRALARQRMRWAEGHTYSVKRYFKRVLGSAKLTAREKLEFLYFSPYYLQPLFLLVGTLFWLVAEVNHRYPAFWSPAFGWSLTISNFLAVPLMGLAGIFLEGDLRVDLSGVLSFVALGYIIAPFQAYAALKGLLEPEEGKWVRTLKTGSITDRVLRLKLRGIMDWMRLRSGLPRFGFGAFLEVFGPFPVRQALMAASMVLMALPVLTELSSLGLGMIGGG